MKVSPSVEMSDSTRRSLRTLYQSILGIIITLPILAAAATSLPDHFPFRAQIVAALMTAAAATAVAAKIINALEDRGVIKSFLYPDEPVLPEIASATERDTLAQATDTGSSEGEVDPSQEQGLFPLDEGVNGGVVA